MFGMFNQVFCRFFIKDPFIYQGVFCIPLFVDCYRQLSGGYLTIYRKFQKLSPFLLKCPVFRMFSEREDPFVSGFLAAFFVKVSGGDD